MKKSLIVLLALSLFGLSVAGSADAATKKAPVVKKVAKKHNKIDNTTAIPTKK